MAHPFHLRLARAWCSFLRYGLLGLGKLRILDWDIVLDFVKPDGVADDSGVVAHNEEYLHAVDIAVIFKVALEGYLPLRVFDLLVHAHYEPRLRVEVILIGSAFCG